MKILVVDDQGRILDLLREVLELQGYEVLTARDGAAALDLYRQHRPPFTLTDISMPGMSGLDLLKQIKACNPEAAVILMTGAGTESYAVEALRGGAVNYFNKPIDIHELTNTLYRYSALATGYDYEHYAGDFFEFEELRLVLSNDIAQVNHAVQMIVNHCRAVFSMSDIFTLRFGLYEMIVNAIEHGNLGIVYKEKAKAIEENRFNELLRERAEDPERAAKRVRIECRIQPQELRCTIEDEGEGFNYQKFMAGDDPASLFEFTGASLNGRGIILTRLQFDEVQFNERGNKVCIIKRTHPVPVLV